jgi:hypothetical protein
MKRKLNHTQHYPTKKLKIIGNDQKIQDLQSDLKLKVSQFDNQIHDFEQKISTLKQDRTKFIKQYYLNKILNKDIDYIFLRDDKNVDRTKFKVINLTYVLFYEATFRGSSIDTCHKEILMDHSIVEIRLVNTKYDESIKNYIDLDEYYKLLLVLGFDLRDERSQVWDEVESWSEIASKDEINTDNYCKTGQVKVEGSFERDYYFIQRKV